MYIYIYIYIYTRYIVYYENINIVVRHLDYNNQSARGRPGYITPRNREQWSLYREQWSTILVAHAQLVTHAQRCVHASLERYNPYERKTFAMKYKRLGII